MSCTEPSDTPDVPGAESVDDSSAAVRAVIEEHDDVPTCTLYPTDVDDVDLMSHWMTADEGSYVALADMR